MFVATAFGVLSSVILPDWLAHQEVTRLLIGWNAGAGLYLLLAGIMMARSTQEKIHYRARLQDEGQFAILTLVIVSTISCLASIVAELAVAKDLTGMLKFAHIALAGLTIVTAWVFTHVMFALHYAHNYYATGNNGRLPGIDFPGQAEPDYSEFIYLAFVIGTSGQTADVSFTSRPMRRLATVHCVLAFFFNTTLLALTINIAASLF